MEYFYRVLTQLEIFSVMILLGVFAVKTNAINEKSLSDLSKLIMRLILPVMIFHKSINGATRSDMMSSFAEVVLASFFMFAVLFAVGYLLKKAFSLTGNYGRILSSGDHVRQRRFYWYPFDSGNLTGKRDALHGAFLHC